MRRSVQERGGGGAVEPAPQAGGEEPEHAAAPLPADGHHLEYKLHEPDAALAVGAVARLPLDDPVPQRPLGDVILRRHTLEGYGNDSRQNGPFAITYYLL